MTPERVACCWSDPGNILKSVKISTHEMTEINLNLAHSLLICFQTGSVICNIHSQGKCNKDAAQLPTSIPTPRWLDFIANFCQEQELATLQRCKINIVWSLVTLVTAGVHSLILSIICDSIRALNCLLPPSPLDHAPELSWSGIVWYNGYGWWLNFDSLKQHWCW